MALKWVNIRRITEGKPEVAVAETEPQIAALWSSSDHSPNITQGQDMGWRLAPEVVVEMKKLKQDLTALERIAARFGKSLEDIGEIDILAWISNKTSLESAPVADVSDYQDEYDAEIRKLENKGGENTDLFGDGGQPLATMTDEELEAELARRKAADPATTQATTQATTTESTTTTTTVAPTTTTTTTVSDTTENPVQ